MYLTMHVNIAIFVRCCSILNREPVFFVLHFRAADESILYQALVIGARVEIASFLKYRACVSDVWANSRRNQALR